MKHIKIALYFFAAIVLLNACQKEYSIEHGEKTTPTGTWQFNDSSQLFAGNMDSSYIDSSTSFNTKILHLIGKSLDGTQTFNLELYAPSFITGTYKASLFQSTFLYTAGGSNIYQANQLIGEFTVIITALTSTNISGTFSGSALNSSNKLIQITQGKFTSSFSNTGSGGGVSSGVLGDSSGRCKPVKLAGTYSQGVALDSSNTVQVQVTVAKAGTYSIKTNTINGVSFSKTGTFTSTGVQNITLTGSGIPTNAGDQHFTLSYGNSQCDFIINFAPPASGTLGGGGGSCTSFAIAGAYQQGIPLDASNTIQVQVNVTTAGKYSISTNIANGVVFSKTGSFTATGVQTILLTGSGTPVAPGVQNFTVTFGTSNCSFSLTFLPGVAPSGDYFPLTPNSNWTFSLAAGTTQDSMYLTVINYAPVFGANTYKTIAQYDVPPSGATDSAYFRKPGGDYYQYMNFSDFIQFDKPVFGEYIFLKDNVVNGSTWNSPNINGTISGIPITGFFKMTILAKAVPVTIATFNFPNVIKVKYEFFVLGSPTPLATAERWFAYNVGEIHTSLTDGISTIAYDIGNYHIF
ncbi:hypothetical protein FW778_06930 [Ginsengibacter hankyongi]|uniref:Uncharacterized protein n=1 Tax=Ginsengibacter hankyongi TaxID=2607284 RepID=A0A5J5IL07_9BACT|nr:hypothetical protein [Ginsengibacter hankyongi]KAA9041746.1 hypothetical protein FW778_06930 [Ginsengibacter hankyongi]